MDADVEVLAQTDNFEIITTEAKDDVIFHLDLGRITLHLASEEWDELVLLVKTANSNE